MSTTTVRVLLADDHAITREGTRRLIETQESFSVIAEAADGEEAIRLTRELEPDIVLLDVSMPRADGLQVARVIRQSLPRTRIVVLTGYDSPPYTRALRHLGVHGYLSKSASTNEILQALRAVTSGGCYYQSSPDNPSPSADATPDDEEPTAREVEVLRLVVEGYRNRDIARQLGLSERTVHFHLTNVFLKLNARSRTEAVFLARQREWIS